MIDRALEYWTPEPLFKGGTAFCMASGPSLTPEICEKVRGRKTLVVNSSCGLAPWADVLYFTDSSWYEQRRDLVANWAGLVVTMSPTAKRELPDKVRRIKGEGDPSFPVRSFSAPGSSVVRQGRSSGHTAVSLLIAMAAKRIVLLGYDMRVVGGREHCHSEYRGSRTTERAEYATQFVPAFNGWNEAALASGCEILNCTPGSAITEFPFADLDEVLLCDPS